MDKVCEIIKQLPYPLREVVNDLLGILGARVDPAAFNQRFVRKEELRRSSRRYRKVKREILREAQQLGVEIAEDRTAEYIVETLIFTGLKPKLLAMKCSVRRWRKQRMYAGLILLARTEGPLWKG